MPRYTPLLLAILTLALAAVSCKEPAKQIITPPGPAPVISEARITTTQLDTSLDSTAVSMDQSSTKLAETAKTIQTDAITGKSLTSPTANTVRYWDSIIDHATGLFSLKSEYDRNNEQIRAARSQVNNVTRQLDEAKLAEAAKEKWWKEHDLKQRQEMDKLKANNQKLSDSLASQIRDKFLWLAVLATAGIGLSVVAGAFFDKTIAKAGAYGFGVVLAISLFVGETLWMLKYAVGVVFLFGVGFAVWKVFIQKRAIIELIQTSELIKERIPKTTRAEMFGVGAARPLLWDGQSKSTVGLVKQYRPLVRKAASLPPPAPAVITIEEEGESLRLV